MKPAVGAFALVESEQAAGRLDYQLAAGCAGDWSLPRHRPSHCHGWMTPGGRQPF
jgi:hypothetical protein